MTTYTLDGQRLHSSARLHFLKTIFSFPAVIAALLATLAAFTVRSRFNDPDMWWQLKTGQIIWNTHTIPTTDLFSYTTHHHAWIPHEWLSQLSIYAAYRLDSYSGLMIWMFLLSSSLLIGGYLLCTLYSGNAKVAFLGAMVLWFFSTSGLAIRPQMVGYLLLIVELLVLQLGHTRNPRWFFALPPLFAIWVNSHGSFFLGFAVAGVFLLCSFPNFRAGSLIATPWPARHRQMLSLALLVSVAALFLNPVGLKLILYPLDTMLYMPISTSQVLEWQPLHLNGARGLGLIGVLACVFLSVITQRTQLQLRELVLLALGTWLALGHQRMVFVFAILSAPILSRHLSSLWEGYNPQEDHPIPNAVLIALAALLTFFAFPSPNNLAKQADEKSPVKALAYITEHHLSGPMLNDYGFGGYLIWAAPQYPVFLDGRGDVFEWTGVLDEFMKWSMLQTNPNTLLDKYNISFCLLARDSSMAFVLPLLPDWKPVYEDNVAVVFTRDKTHPPSPAIRTQLDRSF